MLDRQRWKGDFMKKQKRPSPLAYFVLALLATIFSGLATCSAPAARAPVPPPPPVHGAPDWDNLKSRLDERDNEIDRLTVGTDPQPTIQGCSGHLPKP
jgi:hypothetical protein